MAWDCPWAHRTTILRTLKGLDLYQTPGVAETVDMDHIKRHYYRKKHYYRSHESINPTRTVPKEPILDLTESHDHARFSGQTLPGILGA